ncbi:TolC family protein [Sediminibacterium sp. WSJ-3]|nr:TolC family protein [Sediminibacterium soli]
MRRFLRYPLIIIMIWACTEARAQSLTDTTLRDATLERVVQFAIAHQPLIRQSLLDEAITERQIQSKLADWFPQLNFNYSLQHNFDLPVSFFSGNYVRNGTFNSSAFGLNATQAIFNRDVLLAKRSAEDIRLLSKQNTGAGKIDVAVNVSKAFYDILLSQQQVSVLSQAITRLERSLKDAVSQYNSGIADKTDYKRATIALNNARAQKKQASDLVTAKYTYLKQLMGLSDSSSLQISYDTSLMEKDAVADTNLAVSYQNRIEYRQLQTQQRLQQLNRKYYKNAFLPVVGAFGNYNMAYLGNDFAKVYNNGFVNSNIGLQLALPIFQGNKRIHLIRQAELQAKRVDWDMALLKSRVNTQYQQALAVYKGNLAGYYALKDNVAMADEVYRTLDLQYRSGIKTYLDVIIAEADLRTTQLNYYHALFQLLQSKLDIQRALGTIQY